MALRQTWKRSRKRRPGWVGIYAIIHRHTAYVGRSRDPRGRVRRHWRDAYLRRTAKERWLYKLQRKHIKPVVLILWWAPPEEQGQAEKDGVAFMRRRGFRLANGNGGG